MLIVLAFGFIAKAFSDQIQATKAVFFLFVVCVCKNHEQYILSKFNGTAETSSPVQFGRSQPLGFILLCCPHPELLCQNLPGLRSMLLLMTFSVLECQRRCCHEVFFCLAVKFGPLPAPALAKKKRFDNPRKSCKVFWPTKVM